MDISRPHSRRVALHTYVGALLLSSAVAAHADITLLISDSQGAQGGKAPITVSLQGDGRDIAGVDIDLLFDTAVFGAPAHVTDICGPADAQVHICLGGDNNFQQCTTNSNCPGGICSNAFSVSGTVDVPAPPAGKHRLALSITQPIMNPPPPPIPLGNGAMIVCNLSVLSGAPLGTTVVEGSGPAAFDFNAVSLTPISVGSAEGQTGTVTITEAPTPTPTGAPTETPTPQSCIIDADCPPTTLCVNQVCEPAGPCTSPADCPGQRPCVDGTCQQLAPPTATPTNTVPPPSATPTKVATPTSTLPQNTATPTTTATPKATATNTVPPGPSATNTSAPGGGGGADSDGCSIPQTNSGGSLLWLLIPAAVVVWRRRR
jgi:hypothetical protein